jgi:SAM-dependent methyltransferase
MKNALNEDLNAWEARWRSGQTGWDTGQASVQLAALIEAGAIPQGRALVPGCGSGYDVLALADAGLRAMGLEIAPTAIANFQTLRHESGLGEEQAKILEADYFRYAPETAFDLIWDTTFLCAIEPEQREAWAQTAHRLLKPGGQLITLIFPVPVEPGTLGSGPHPGPPYPLDPYAVRDLLLPRFEMVRLTPASHSHPAREGREWLGIWQRR